MPLYLIGMSRSSGIDIDNYRRFYDQNSSDIFDPGFSFLVNISKFLNLGFEGFIFCIGVLNAFLYIRISKFFQVNYGILLLILMLHLFIVRDFSQFRVGLAVAIIIYSFTYKSNLKYLGYLIGLSIHITSAVLLALLVYYDLFLKNKYSFVRILFPFVCIFIAGLFIEYLGAIDPRIDIYLNWNREGYGDPVSDFKQPIFILFLLIMHLYFFRVKLFSSDLFIFCYLCALLTFISFSEYAIFSYRLSNIAISLYPITLAKIFETNRPSLNKVFAIILFILLVSLRDNSFLIINSIMV